MGTVRKTFIVRYALRLTAFAILLFVVYSSGALRGQGGVHPLSGRRYAGTMDVSGAEWLDRAEREAEEAPAKALTLIGVTPGMSVADVGAGSGYFTIRLASMVGPAGRVYANDIQAGMLDIIRGKIAREGLKNVSLVLGTQDDPRLPPASVDLVLMVDVYHELRAPQVMLRRLREVIRPGGRLVLLEYRKEDPQIPINPTHKMSVAEAKLEVEAEGYSLTSVDERLPWQHILIFSRK